MRVNLREPFVKYKSCSSMCKAWRELYIVSDAKRPARVGISARRLVINEFRHGGVVSCKADSAATSNTKDTDPSILITAKRALP